MPRISTSTPDKSRPGHSWPGAATVLITGTGLRIQAQPRHLLEILRQLSRSYATLGELSRLGRH